MGSLENILSYHLMGKTSNILFHDNLILRKPIGIGTKSYGFMETMLHRNIGSHQFDYDGFGTTIGMASNPYLNSEIDPWFMLDESKQKYDNYMSYVNDMYFHGTMLPPNFQTVDNITVLNDYNGILKEMSRVGAIHHYDIDNIVGARLFIPNGSTNPNGYDDTRLGVINNFYLSATLRNSYDNMLMRKTSSYHKPSFGIDENVLENSYSVTQGAYFKFGLKGEYGINNGTFALKEGGVTPQSLYTDDIITWSTVDNYYTSNSNNEKEFENYPYGNFYNISYSLGLLSASGEKTKEFIAKSIYGINLMDDFIPSLEFNESDLSLLRKKSRKKYFASIGGRGTNYIDVMTNNDVKYESDSENNNIRLLFNNPGNDNLYNYNTYLVYSEAEGNKESVTFDNGITVNIGTIINKYQTYDVNVNKKDIINYTNQQFKNNKFKTIIGKFHTDSVERDLISSAVSQYGMSHGRNLLNKDHKNSEKNGFHDPYCRVWTYHKQYSKYSDLIRPFDTNERVRLNDILKKTYQVNRQHLLDNGVKCENGLLRIAPKNNKDITACMFSIENLAWRDSKTSQQLYKDNSKYAIGPNGGRIMWFPPYGLTFQESSKANWNASQFIGRGEKIYSYVDTERTGSLSFEMLIDHPSLLNSVNKMSSDAIGDVDDVNSMEQQILRFFAGCDVFSSPSINRNEKKENESKMTFTPIPVVKNSVIENFTIEFDVYFPYGYSGKDSDINWYDYLINGIGCEYENKDFYSDNKLKQLIGGYEMDGEEGLSCVKKWEEYPPASYDGYSRFRITKDVYYESYGTVIPKFVLANKVKNESGKEVFWGHLIDSKYSVNRNSSNFENVKNYLDNESYHLNSKLQNENKYNDTESLKVSFCDFAIFMGVECTETKKNIISSEKNQKLLKSLFNEYKVNKVKVDGYSYLDKELGESRAQQVAKWLRNNTMFNDVEYELKSYFVEDITTKSNTDIKNKPNSKKAKKQRKVSVSIILQKEIFDTDIDYHNNLNNTIVQKSNNEKISNEIRINSMALLALSNIKEYERKLSKINEERTEEKLNIDNLSYNEYDFFQQINSDNSFFRNKILDKIKYFDPAYHSITPEGFNSRLTFLHQCTRQGPTNSFKDNGVNVRNLSFGQPPICVLRIGDFYNTKIIIDSLNIKYDEATWDLNDEGIGVMPMMAQIDISFSFIGGSDLSGAVDILQNAVSFNYYANTSVYEPNATKINNKKINGNENTK